ncbi:hypothetical protein HSX11_07965 [Oxalobacteraceae bacterium]|nr:hypothetical protein [Oxalobacteraceae bacterium]
MNRLWRMSLLFLLASGVAQMATAAQWARLSKHGGSTFYIDKGSIARIDQNRKVWSMQSFGSPQTSPDGKTYRSIKELHLYSCTERTTTLQSQVYYPDAMGKGEPVGNFKYEKFSPEDIVPDSPYDNALAAVCKR